MKHLKHFLVIILAVALFMSALPMGVSAFAAGSGTAENPYVVTTAAQLQNINSDVSAHYVLGANIHLNQTDFTPIGNADAGAFSGSFDGAGYTIAGLNVFSGKYAGLFGCNEGTIKNVTLADVYVYGTRHLGGVVGENTALGVLENCKVLGGKIESDGGLSEVHAGGICGSNSGNMNSNFSNSAEIVVKNEGNNAFAGGIIGWSEVAVNLQNTKNTGNVTTNNTSSDDYIYTGGLVGLGSTLIITDSYNTGKVISTSTSRQYYKCYTYSGGLVGRGTNSISITGSYNIGNVSSSASATYSAIAYSSGLIGVGNNSIIITGSYNIGNVYSYSYSTQWTGDAYSGGLVGNGSSTITGSYNTGSVTSPSQYSYSGGLVGCGSYTIFGSYNTGKVTSFNYTGGLVGKGSGTITGSYNTGNVISSDYFGGLVGDGSSTITGSYNTGNGTGYYDSYGLVGRFNSENITASYSLNSARQAFNNDGTVYLSEAAFHQSASFKHWDFDGTWAVDSNVNGGFPYLKACHSPLSLNISNNTLLAGENFQLQAYKNGDATSAVTWSVSAGNAFVSATGRVVAAAGMATITATDAQGNKANCNIYGMTENLTLSAADFSVTVGDSGRRSFAFGSSDASDFLVKAYSSDDSVVSISRFCGATYAYKANAAGTATLYFETVQGCRFSCTVTVTNAATGVSVSDYMSTMARGSSYLFKASTSPNPTSSKLSWRSSDESVATVDSNGLVRAVAKGSCRITVQTDNGYSAYRDITVNAPITSMAFETPNITVYKGDTRKLNLIYSPTDTTDTISYSLSDYSTYSGLSVDSDGTVSAKSTGQYTVRARASGGAEAFCRITVTDYPVIVTAIAVDQSEKALRVGEVFKLTATISPSNASDKAVTWASTDESVASVSPGGIVEAKGAGKAVVTATSSNGIIAACEVSVSGVASLNRAKIYIPDVISTTEGMVEVPVMIENNPGISFASLSVSYNPEAVEPIEVNNGDLFESVLGTVESSENRVKLCFTSADTIAEDGVLARIRFRILDAEKPAEIKLAYYPGNIREGEQKAVELNIAEGFVDLAYHPLYSLTYSCPEVAGREASLILSNGETRYTVDSSNGVFTLESTIPGGTYNFYIKPRYGLATLVESGFDFEGATLQSVEIEGHTTPLLGDVNEDDVIDIADISVLLSTANYGKANTQIDLTADSVISVEDIAVALQAQNYGNKSVEIV